MTSDERVATPLNLHEYEAVAREQLPRMVFDYIASGADDEVTVRANRSAFAQWRLLPRVLRGVTQADTSTTVLGQPIALPVMLAPTAFHRQVHPDGELATARAAHDSATIFTLSTMASQTIEAVAAMTDRWWYQLYIFQDRAITRDLVQRAEAAGASALVVTVDVPKLGRREADERNGFALPAGVVAANFAPAHLQAVRGQRSGSGLASYTAMNFDAALTWNDLEWLATLTKLPIVPKGILAPADAQLAFMHGASALIISNHGGRQLDETPPALDVLPAIVDATQDQGELYIDGGFRRGTDVLKALALGARAVLIGRPYLWGLAVGGESGVRHVLSLLRDEIALDVLLCGCTRVSDISRECIVPAGPLRSP
jgi:4-hydroxymandelate oxidase